MINHERGTEGGIDDDRSTRGVIDDDRAVTPVVGKALEAAVVVLFVGLITTTLYAGVVPGYRTTAGDELAERTLATASHRIQASIPPNATAVAARTTVDIPETIRGEGYTVRIQNRTLVLDHPQRGVGARARLALPGYVTSVEGGWHSRDPAIVRITRARNGVAVRLQVGEDEAWNDDSERESGGVNASSERITPVIPTIGGVRP